MQGSSYAPLQFLRSPWNRDVYTAIDNQIDGRTTLVLYLGAASTLPSELQKYNVGCILIHKDEKQIYLNIGSDTTPTWQSFGPGTNTLPTPFVTGQYLTNDGVDAFWSLIDLATGVTGLLDSDHIDLSDLANNSDFIDYLIANSYFTSSLAGDTNFLTNLITNINTSGTLAVVTDGVTITGDGTTGNPLVAVGGGGTGTSLEETITQTAHGFVVGDVVRSSYVSGEYTKAQADTDDNSAVIGIVSSVVNANEFIMTKAGSMTLTTGFAIGDALFLSPTTAGLITNIAPTTVGLVIAPLGYVVATNEIDVKILRADEIGSGNVASGSSLIKNIVGNFTVPAGLPTPINIAHGLGYAPSKMTIKWFQTTGSNTSSVGLRSDGFADFSTGDNNCFYARFNNAGLGTFENMTSNTYCLYWESLGSGQTPFGLTATADNTNIIFTPSGATGPNPIIIYYSISIFA